MVLTQRPYTHMSMSCYLPKSCPGPPLSMAWVARADKSPNAPAGCIAPPSWDFSTSINPLVHFHARGNLLPHISWPEMSSATTQATATASFHIHGSLETAAFAVAQATAAAVSTDEKWSPVLHFEVSYVPGNPHCLVQPAHTPSA